MSFQDLKILIVEDDQNTLSTIRTMLKEIGITQIIEGSDGKKALDVLDTIKDGETDIDLIISDWNMPHKTGIELLRDIRQAKPDLPFIMLSARADMNSVESALIAKVTYYIRKPFTLDELEDKIKRAYTTHIAPR